MKDVNYFQTSHYNFVCSMNLTNVPQCIVQLVPNNGNGLEISGNLNFTICINALPQGTRNSSKNVWTNSKLIKTTANGKNL